MAEYLDPGSQPSTHQVHASRRLWIDDGSMWLSGPETRSWTPVPTQRKSAVGIRFQSGIGPSILGLDASDVLDARIRLDLLWGDRRARELGERIDGLSQARPPSARDLVRLTGLSERQLHRRCTAAFGNGPAVLTRILRLRRVLQLARSQRQHGLAELASAAGYDDQQHLAHDVQACSG